MRNDIQGKLQASSYDGIHFPVSAFAWGYTRHNVFHKFAYIDREWVQSLGRSNKVFKYEIPLYENGTIDEKNEYTILYPKLKLAFEEKSHGDLITPDFGTFKVVVSKCDVVYDTNKRTGVALSVEFIEAPSVLDILEESADMEFQGPEALDSLANRLDAELPEANLTELPDINKDSIADAVKDVKNAVNGVQDQVALARDQVKGQIDSVIADLDAINTAADKSTDPTNWRLKRQVNDLKLALQNTRNTVDETGRRVVSEVVSTPKQLAQIAMEAKMTIDELIKLNSSIAKAPVVAAGTVIQKYA